MASARVTAPRHVRGRAPYLAVLRQAHARELARQACSLLHYGRGSDSESADVYECEGARVARFQRGGRPLSRHALPNRDQQWNAYADHPRGAELRGHPASAKRVRRALANLPERSWLVVGCPRTLSRRHDERGASLDDRRGGARGGFAAETQQHWLRCVRGARLGCNPQEWR